MTGKYLYDDRRILMTTIMMAVEVMENFRFDFRKVFLLP